MNAKRLRRRRRQLDKHRRKHGALSLMSPSAAEALKAASALLVDLVDLCENQYPALTPFQLGVLVGYTLQEESTDRPRPDGYVPADLVLRYGALGGDGIGVARYRRRFRRRSCRVLDAARGRPLRRRIGADAGDGHRDAGR